MNQQTLYTIVFTDGTETEEFGSSEADVREFLARSFGHLTIQSIKPLH
jgi:hypothetical protein